MLPLSRPHSDDKIRQTEEYLQKHSDRDVSIDSLADRIGMGTAQFHSALQGRDRRLPGAYTDAGCACRRRKIARARSRIDPGVCSKIGYEDVAFFRVCSSDIPA